MTLAAAAALSGWSPADTANNIVNGQSNLSAPGTYSAGLPTATSDVTFLSGVTYAPTTFTVASGSALNFGTLNDLDGTQSLTIQNAAAVASPTTITLNGGSNSVAPSTSDLLYVVSGGTLTIQNNNSTLGLILAASGNLNIAGTASISSIITMGANAITKTGTGTLTINGANSGTGGFTIAQGTVATNSNTGLGSSNNAVSLGLAGSANNATLLVTGGSGIAQNFTIATGAGTRTITSANGTAFGSNGVVFNSANTITLNHDLITSVTNATPNVGNIQYRGVISGGSALIVDAANTGFIQLNAANTFTGGVAINAGTAVAGIASVGSAGAITSGAFGTGSVTLGSTGSATAATLGINGAVGVLNNLTVTSGGTRTIGMLNSTTTAGSYGGPITLNANADLTLTAVARTGATNLGADVLRVGSGGFTGSSNIIINNSNTATGAVVGSGAIRLDGSATPTAWTGNLIVQAGQGSLGTVTAIGSGNTVGVTAGALFNFDGNGTFNPTIAGLANATAGALGGTTGGTVYHNQASNQTLTLGGSGTYSFAGTIANALNGTNTTAITKSGAGTQILDGSNTYTGATTVGTAVAGGSGAGAVTSATANGGTLEAAADGALGSGGTFNTNGSGEATTVATAGVGTSAIAVQNGGTLLLSNAAATDRVSNTATINLGTSGAVSGSIGGTLAIAPLGTETNAIREGTGAQVGNVGSPTGTNAIGLGVLTLSSSSTLDLGANGVGTLVFAGFAPATFTLSITNWSNTTFNAGAVTSGIDGSHDRLIFNKDMTASLGQISFGVGFGGTEQVALGGGFYELGAAVVPVPEPSTLAMAGLMLGLLGYRERRRFRRAGTPLVKRS